MLNYMFFHTLCNLVGCICTLLFRLHVAYDHAHCSEISLPKPQTGQLLAQLDASAAPSRQDGLF